MIWGKYQKWRGEQMKSMQCLYKSEADFAERIQSIDIQKECLVQIFTSVLRPEECIALAKKIKKILPHAHIAGASVNVVTYKGEKYEQQTLIAVEQYKNIKVATKLLDTTGKKADVVAGELQAKWEEKHPKFLRMFLGGYYVQAQQLLEKASDFMLETEILCGMSGKLSGIDQMPFVFNGETSLIDGLVCVGIFGRVSPQEQSVNDSFENHAKEETKSTTPKDNKKMDSDESTNRDEMSEFYRYFDPDLQLHNMLQYEPDKEKFGFDKICLLKVENADMLIGFMGQSGYFIRMREMISALEQMNTTNGEENLWTYVVNSDSFVIAAGAQWTKEQFLEMAKRMANHCDHVQDGFMETPVIVRMAVVTGTEYLLEQAYSLLEIHKSSQSRIVVGKMQLQDKESTKKELECINLIQYAIAENRVIPYYQGLYNNQTKKIDKYEALMRICDKNGNILTPHYFLELSKKYRLYLDLNLKMFEAVLEDFSKIDCEVNINLCAHDIDSPRFRKVLRERLQQFHKPQNLTFEILEDEYFDDIEVLKEFMLEVRSYGAKIAIDDFGSGYSNLLEIVKIHPDYLKIDGQIIRESHMNYENEMIVNVIATLGKQLDIELVAEFVENQEVQNIIEKYEIMCSQGYHFSKPQPFDMVLEAEKDRII